MAAPYIRVHLISFGPLRSVFAEGGEWRELAVAETVGGLLHHLRDEGRITADVVASLAVAVNELYASSERVLEDGDEVAILPPVSGGADDLVALVREPIEAEALMGAIKAGADGAVRL